ncbi:hypothetical protein [Nocardia nova]|uniref:hypothetical protein n=1 Tax=Nocardia nova TaxID=37330 RepID=UPI0033C28AF8
MASSGTTSVRANGVDLGIESFGRENDPLVVLVGAPTPKSLRRDCSSWTTWVPPFGTSRPTGSLPPCSRSDR